MAADDGAAQRKICVEILARRRPRAARESILNLLEGLETDQRLMVTFAERHSPLGRFDIAGVHRAREQPRDFPIAHGAVTSLRKSRLRFQKAFHFGLELEASAGIRLQCFLHDRGERFVAHEYSAVAARFLVAIADWGSEHVVAPLHARLHLLQGLTPVLKALQLALRGKHGFNELPFGSVLELEIEAFNGRVVRRELLSQFQMENGVSREPLQIIEDHDAVVAPALLQKLEHGDHTRALHEVAAAGDIVVEHCFDAIPTSCGIFAASMFLTV